MGYAKTYQVIGVAEDFWHKDYRVFAKRLSKFLQCNMDVDFWDWTDEAIDGTISNEILDFGFSETRVLLVERFGVAQVEDFKKDTSNRYSIDIPIEDPTFKNFNKFPETGHPVEKDSPYFDMCKIEFLPSGITRFASLHCDVRWEHHLDRLMHREPTSLEVNHRDSYRDFFCALGITKVIMLPDEDYCSIEVHTKAANDRMLTINELMVSFETKDRKCFVSYNVNEMRLNEELLDLLGNDVFLVGDINFK